MTLGPGLGLGLAIRLPVGLRLGTGLEHTPRLEPAGKTLKRCYSVQLAGRRRREQAKGRGRRDGVWPLGVLVWFGVVSSVRQVLCPCCSYIFLPWACFLRNVRWYVPFSVYLRVSIYVGRFLFTRGRLWHGRDVYRGHAGLLNNWYVFQLACTFHADNVFLHINSLVACQYCPYPCIAC